MSKFSLNFLKKTTNRFNDFIQNLFSKYESSIFNKLNYKFLKTNFLQEKKRDKTIFGIVFIIFSILGYLSLPIIFDDTLMKNKIKYEVKNYFNLDFENYDDLEYRILPTPHFLLKEKKLLFEAKDMLIFMVLISLLDSVFVILSLLTIVAILFVKFCNVLLLLVLLTNVWF